MDAAPLRDTTQAPSVSRPTRIRSSRGPGNAVPAQSLPTRDAPEAIRVGAASALVYRQTATLIHNVLERDGFVLLPSAGGYALAALPTSAPAIAQMEGIANRDRHPVPVAAASVVMAANWTRLDTYCARVAEEMWPGPLALVLPVHTRAARTASRLLHGPEGTLAVYVTSAGVERTLAAEAGIPLAIVMIRDPAGRVVQDYAEAVDWVWSQLDGLGPRHRAPWAAVRAETPFSYTDGPTLARLQRDGHLAVVTEGAVAATKIAPLLHRVAISEERWV